MKKMTGHEENEGSESEQRLFRQRSLLLLKNCSSYFQININYSGEHSMSNPPVSEHNEPKGEKRERKKKDRKKVSA